MSLNGNLFIVSAPSGAGKTSLVKALLQEDARVGISISHTTRAKRPAEADGIDYHFIDEAAFSAMIAKQAFLEHAYVHGKHYGTAKTSVDSLLKDGKDVVLEIDWQGAEQIRKLYCAAKSIFILPPSIEALEARLKARGQDDAAIIQQRVAAAREEMLHVDDYDYVIINDNFAEALRAFIAIISAERFKTDLQKARHRPLLQELTTA